MTHCYIYPWYCQAFRLLLVEHPSSCVEYMLDTCRTQWCQRRLEESMQLHYIWTFQEACNINTVQIMPVRYLTNTLSLTIWSICTGRINLSPFHLDITITRLFQTRCLRLIEQTYCHIKQPHQKRRHSPFNAHLRWYKT